MRRTLIAVIVAGSLRSLWRICNRCGGFAIRHLLLSGFVIRFDFIINILFNNGNVQQTFLPSIVYR